MTTWCLEVARRIGRGLAADAIWHEGQCNWVGSLPEPGPGDTLSTSYAALTPDLYGGTSGVALFLAELFASTGDEELRATALGAARQAVAHADAVPPSAPGVHVGRLGIALATARTGQLIAEPALTEQAMALERDVAPAAETGFDLMGGSAGAVIGLLALEPLLGAEPVRARAERFGRRLLAAAARDGGTLSWPLGSSADAPHLTGLSHGAAGAAVAFLELQSVTGEPAWGDAAEQAFAYERRLYEPRMRNWPDLRRTGNRFDGGPSFPVFWCHGAPGIALSRLRALQLLRDPRAREEAVAALDTTRAAVYSEIERAGNFSLCHGLSGNAEVLLLGRAVLGEERADDEKAALDAAAHGAETYAEGGSAWPCGTYDGQTPSLFLGLAGIGRFYLRLYEPSLPSVLLPTLSLANEGPCWLESTDVAGAGTR